MRLSIDVTSEQHKKLKAIAAIQGKSIKDYVLEKSLPRQNSNNKYDQLDEEETFRKLEMLFDHQHDNVRIQRNPTKTLERAVYDLIAR